MYKHSACSFVITPSLSFYFRLPFSLCPFPAHVPPRTSSPSSSPCLLSLWSKFACRVMKSHRHAPVPAEHALPLFEFESDFHIIVIYNIFEAHFPINNACVERIVVGEPVKWMMVVKPQWEDVAHQYTKQNICVCLQYESASRRWWPFFLSLTVEQGWNFLSVCHFVTRSLPVSVVFPLTSPPGSLSQYVSDSLPSLFACTPGSPFVFYKLYFLE